MEGQEFQVGTQKNLETLLWNSPNRRATLVATLRASLASHTDIQPKQTYLDYLPGREQRKANTLIYRDDFVFSITNSVSRASHKKIDFQTFSMKHYSPMLAFPWPMFYARQWTPDKLL